MKCISCDASIPPEWVSCIQENKCPGCGHTIMNEEAKELLDELRGAMEKMPNDPEGLAGWLLSNYTLRKTGKGEPTNFHRKASTSSKEVNLKIANNPVHEFLKRTNVPHALENQQKLKAIVKGLHGGENELYGDGVSVDVEEDESEMIGQDVLAKNVLANNSLIAQDNNRSPLSLDERKAMIHTISKEEKENNVNEALRRSRIERLRTQSQIAGGGTPDFGSGKGTFKRNS